MYMQVVSRTLNGIQSQYVLLLIRRWQVDNLFYLKLKAQYEGGDFSSLDGVQSLKFCQKENVTIQCPEINIVHLGY